jgi:hypothetical protein
VGQKETPRASGAFLFGGRGGIRTHGTLAGTMVFKTISIDHSDTLPEIARNKLRNRGDYSRAGRLGKGQSFDVGSTGLAQDESHGLEGGARGDNIVNNNHTAARW